MVWCGGEGGSGGLLLWSIYHVLFVQTKTLQLHIN